MRKISVNLITVTVCALLLVVGMVWVLVRPHDAVSKAERRYLKQFPETTLATVMNGQWMDGLEDFLLDQFPMRDSFRSLKATVQNKIFGQKDNNGVYLYGEHVGKLEYPMKENSVLSAAEKIEKVREKYLADTDCKVYAAVIWDKNAYLAPEAGRPSMDYARLQTMYFDALPWAECIDLSDTLTLDSFYSTDPHWRQECLTPVLERLGETMGFETKWSYETESFAPFYGAYYGQSAVQPTPDTILCLHNEVLDGCVDHNLEKNTETGLYRPELLDGMDGYDVFLGGACALQILKNPNGTTGRELVLFRDSFGSSIAPLLLEQYDAVTLVDLRYISADYVGQFVEFTDQDVLFLYSTLILNNSEALR